MRYSIKSAPVYYNKCRHILVCSTGKKIEFNIYEDEMGWYQGIGLDQEFQAGPYNNFCAMDTKREIKRLIKIHAERGELEVYNFDTEEIIESI